MNLVRMAAGLFVEGFQGLTGNNHWRLTKMENQRCPHGAIPIHELGDCHSLLSFPQTLGRRGGRLR